MAGWAAALGILYSWRDQMSYSIESLLESIGSEWLKIYNDNTGLKAKQKARMLEEAGLQAQKGSTCPPRAGSTCCATAVVAVAVEVAQEGGKSPAFRMRSTPKLTRASPLPPTSQLPWTSLPPMSPARTNPSRTSQLLLPWNRLWGSKVTSPSCRASR